MIPFTATTIIAPSTPPGEGMRSILRISGKKAFEALETVLPSNFSCPRKFSAFFTSIHIPHLPPIPALVLTMKAPHSYTTEDMVELHLPGAQALVEEVLTFFLSQGLSLAKPGEFTQRAYLGGRINLMEAEAILALIESSSEEELAFAQKFISSSRGQEMKKVRDLLAELLAEVHGFIDFPDYDVEPEEEDAFHQKIQEAWQKLKSLESAFFQQERVDQPRIAIWGMVNSGKSSLFNALLGESKALTSPTPFTTRDILEASFNFHSPSQRKWTCRLVDLPGFHDKESADLNELEQLAYQRTLETLGEMDFVLFLWNPKEPEKVQKKHLEVLLEKNIPLRILSIQERVSSQDEKQNGAGKQQKKDCKARLENSENRIEIQTQNQKKEFEITLLSLTSQEELEALKEELATYFSFQERGFFSQQQREIFLRSLNALERAAQMDLSSVELMAIEIEEALDALGILTGEVVYDEILDILFSRFCIGK
ncbi:MAG: GTP-binding protein [Planctomycetota bacterium]|nr:MAG: GTP-binding protein [Planctomycetota bacterium]